MKLDERSQQALVVIVQNAIHDRVSELTTSSEARYLEQMQELTN